MPEQTKIDLDTYVARFLTWRLPDDFNPDNGIAFKGRTHPNQWPVGTNLLTATQARDMLAYILDVK